MALFMAQDQYTCYENTVAALVKYSNVFLKMNS